jgi:hypothetical protein
MAASSDPPSTWPSPNSAGPCEEGMKTGIGLGWGVYGKMYKYGPAYRGRSGGRGQETAEMHDAHGSLTEKSKTTVSRPMFSILSVGVLYITPGGL